LKINSFAEWKKLTCIAVKGINIMGNRIKLELEFFVNSSPNILYNYISSASELSKWFADSVNVRGQKNIIFKWEDGDEREAEIIRVIPKKSIRFKWLDDTIKDEYFEMSVSQDNLTNDVVLIITVFVDEDEAEMEQELWKYQVEELKNQIGA
jgi:uncharacterized protein YndB with AHSA1/START domain